MWNQSLVYTELYQLLKVGADLHTEGMRDYLASHAEYDFSLVFQTAGFRASSVFFKIDWYFDFTVIDKNTFLYK